MDLILLMMVIWSAGVIIYLAGAFSDANAAPDNGTAAADTVLDASIEDTATPIREADAIVSSKLLIDNGFIDPDNNCELCTRMVYTPGSKSEAGIAYKDDTVDLGNAERIVFFAKGEQAQEVSFVAAGNSTGTSNTNDTDIFPRIDFAVATDNVTLKNDWQRFEIGLNGTDLSDASYPFGIQMTADSSQKQTFFIKGVTLDTKPPVNPLPTAFDSLLNSTEPLTAKIAANSTNSTAATTIEFTANTTGGLAPYSMKWDFGDGNSTDNVGQKALRTFDKPGDYNITLSAEDSGTPSQNTSASMLITISPAANKTDSELSNSTEPLTAKIAANSTNSTAATTIEFTANTTGGLAPYSMKWDFGDGNSTDNVGQKALRTFDKPGDYNITLSAEDSGTPSQNTSASMLITISPAANKTDSELSNLTMAATNSTLANATATISDTNSTLANATATISDTNSTLANATATISDTNSTLANATATISDTNSTLANATATISDTNSTTGLNTYGIAGIHGTPAIKNTTHTTPVATSLTGSNYTISSNTRNSSEELHDENLDQITIASPRNVTIGTDKTINVKSLNHPPVAGDQSLTLDANETANITLKGNDQDKDLITFDLTSSPSKGTIVGFDSKLGSLTYVPNPNSDSIDSFTFKVTDTKEEVSSIAKVSIKVLNPIPDTSPASSGRQSIKDIHGTVSKENMTIRGSSDSNLQDVSSTDHRLVERPVQQQSELINHDPSVNAGPDRTVYEATNAVTLKGNARDTDGDRLSYSWEQASGEPAVLSDANTVKPKFNAPDVNGDTVLVFKLTVSDGKGGQGTDDVKIRVRDKPGDNSEVTPVEPQTSNFNLANHDPSVNAGPDRTVYEGTNGVTLKGTARDTDGDRLSYSWEQASGEPAVLSDANTVKPKFNAPDVNGDTVLVFKLTVSDGKGGQGTDDVKIRVRDKPGDNSEVTPVEPQTSNFNLANHDPSVNAGPDRTVYEGTNGVTLKGTARDTDGDRLSYSWEQASGEPAVLSDANTVKPKFNAPDVNGDTVLVFKLTVSDGKGGQGTDDVKIRVRDKPGDNSQLARDLSREPIPADYQTSDFIK